MRHTSLHSEEVVGAEFCTSWGMVNNPYTSRPTGSSQIQKNPLSWGIITPSENSPAKSKVHISVSEILLFQSSCWGFAPALSVWLSHSLDIHLFVAGL